MSGPPGCDDTELDGDPVHSSTARRAADLAEGDEIRLAIARSTSASESWLDDDVDSETVDVDGHDAQWAEGLPHRRQLHAHRGHTRGRDRHRDQRRRPRPATRRRHPLRRARLGAGAVMTVADTSPRTRPRSAACSSGRGRRGRSRRRRRIKLTAGKYSGPETTVRQARACGYEAYTWAGSTVESGVTRLDAV